MHPTHPFRSPTRIPVRIGIRRIQIRDSFRRIPKSVRAALALFALVMGSVAPGAAIGAIYVAPAPTGDDGSGDGSRGAPFGTIQHAMDAAPVGGEVVLLEGTYHGAGNRDLTYRGKAMTVRSEAGRERTILTGVGPEAGDHRGFNFDSGETAASVLEGVTITGFEVRNPYGDRTRTYGAGIRIANSSPVIRDCIVSGNESLPEVIPFPGVLIPSLGAGVYVEGGAPTFRGCSIVNNLAAARCASGSCADGAGAGIYARNAKLLLEDCSVSGNIAEYSGGLGNYSIAGGVLLSNCEATLSRCTIADNQATTFAGLRIYNGRTCVVNCTIHGNRNIGIRYDSSYSTSTLHVVHCTVANNRGESASFAAGLSCAGPGQVSVRNSIVAFNDINSGGQIGFGSLRPFTSRGGNFLSDNTDSLPLHPRDIVSRDLTFTEPSPLRDGFVLEPAPSSLTVDAGVLAHSPTFDQVGHPRSCDGNGDGNSVPDTGAVEFQGDPCTSALDQIRTVLLGSDLQVSSEPTFDGIIDVADLIVSTTACGP